MSLLNLGIGLGGQLLGGIFGNSAAREQRRAAERQAALFQQQAAQQRADLSPYMQAGQNALGRLESVNDGNYSAFEQSPDYQFALDQSMRANDRSAAARGSLYSGGADADRMQLASGLASQNLQNYLGRMQQQAGMGQQAATSLGSFGAQMTGAQAGAIGAQGQARANGYGSWMDAINGSGALIGNYLGGRAPSTPAPSSMGVWSLGGTGGIGAGLGGGSRWGG